MLDVPVVIATLCAVVAAIFGYGCGRKVRAAVNLAIRSSARADEAEASRRAWAAEAMRLQMLLDKASDLVETAYEEDFGKALRLFRTLGIPMESHGMNGPRRTAGPTGSRNPFTLRRLRMSSTHACPAGCGRSVPNHQFACRTDWFRLPRDLRRAITGNYLRDREAHAVAMKDACDWYRDNPKEPTA